MKKLLSYLIINSISLYLVTIIFPTIKIGGLQDFLILSIIIGLVNFTLGKLLKVLTLPLNFVSFGLFSFIINGFLLRYSFELVNNSSIKDVTTAILVSVILAITNRIIGSIFK